MAQARGTGDRALLEVAVRLADHLVETFGPGRRHAVDGHPVIEMALVELYRETGTPAYLELARYFVEARGHGLMAGHGEEPTYFSDRVPVREQTTVEGHAVRAVYLAAGATDVAAETGDAELLAALQRQFAHMVATKTYLTGGLGSRWDREAFGDPYELPPDRAYAETCAAIGGLQWAWRMLLATGDRLYADVAERMLLQRAPAGRVARRLGVLLRQPAAAAGRRARRRRPQPRARPARLVRVRLLPAQRHAHAGQPWRLPRDHRRRGDPAPPLRSGHREAGDMRLTVETDYPWDGLVRVRVEQAPAREWTLSLRVPAWAYGATLAVDGEPHDVAAGTYASVRRQWRVATSSSWRCRCRSGSPPPTSASTPSAAASRSSADPSSTPSKQVDQAPDVRVDTLRLDRTGWTRVERRPDLLGGVTVVHAVGRRSGSPDPGGPYRDAAMTGPAATGPEVPIVAVPYFAWANRGVGAMRVWLPEASPASLPTA